MGVYAYLCVWLKYWAMCGGCGDVGGKVVASCGDWASLWVAMSTAKLPTWLWGCCH